MFERERNFLRTGEISKLLLLAISSILALVALSYATLLLRPNAQRAVAGKTVKVYCAAGIAKPVQLLVNAFNRDCGGRIEIARIGGSGELAGQIKTEFQAAVAEGADIYITADELLLDKAAVDGVVAERFHIAKQEPVIAVAADSKLKFDSLRQLVQNNEVRFGIASERAAVGKMIRSIAESEQILDELETAKALDAENVMILAQALTTGSLDVVVVWDTTIAQINQEMGKEVLKACCRADESGMFKSKIGIGIVSSTESPSQSLKFARYLAATETAKEIFDRFGFTFIPGDRWEEIPEIHLFCGSMFTPVIEPAIREFAKREGINAYPRWEGCGKLVASIRSNSNPELFPDAFLACDEMFLDEVKQYFKEPVAFSTNQIVIAMRADLGVTIKSPEDLLDRDLRIGICDPELSALGKLTKLTLSETPYGNLYSKIKGQTAVTVDVGPTLVSQLVAGGLDVIFVYRSNIEAARDTNNMFKIVELDPKAVRQYARQPWAISRTTDNPALMERLFEHISRPDIQLRLQKFGFGIN